MAKIETRKAARRLQEITVTAFVFVVSNLRPMLIICLLLILNLIALETLRLMSVIRSTAITAQRTADEWSETARRQQKQIDLLFRQTDDVARVLDNAQGIMGKLNRETIPEVNGLTKDARRLLQRSAVLVDETTIMIIRSRDGVDVLIKQTDLFVKQATELLRQIKLDVIIDNLEGISLVAKGTLIEVEASSGEIRKWLPDVLKEIKVISEQATAISKNGNKMSDEMAVLLKRINTPLSKKEKFINIMLRVLVALSPALVESLRR